MPFHRFEFVQILGRVVIDPSVHQETGNRNPQACVHSKRAVATLLAPEINKTNSENTEGDFRKRPVRPRLTKPESESNEDDIIKQPRIRQQNQKTGKRKAEDGCNKNSANTKRPYTTLNLQQILP